MRNMQHLENTIRSLQKVIVAYSGGVDSTLVAYVANKMLGTDALIVLARTETITSEDVDLAKTIAQKHGFNFREILYNELEVKNYAANPVNRCFFCKQELYKRLGEIAEEENIPHILDGGNVDDLGDYRPGRIAAREYEVRSPLIEAGMTKSDVRKAAAFYDLPNHDKPAAPCLSSRIPYGIAIDQTSLNMIAQAERYIRQKGFRNVRVRHHQTTAKIEVDPSSLEKLRALYDDIQSHLNTLGYKEVVIDQEGFKTGKLNREIVQHEK